MKGCAATDFTASHMSTLQSDFLWFRLKSPMAELSLRT